MSITLHTKVSVYSLFKKMAYPRFRHKADNAFHLQHRLPKYTRTSAAYKAKQKGERYLFHRNHIKGHGKLVKLRRNL